MARLSLVAVASLLSTGSQAFEASVFSQARIQQQQMATAQLQQARQQAAAQQQGALQQQAQPGVQQASPQQQHAIMQQQLALPVAAQQIARRHAAVQQMLPQEDLEYLIGQAMLRALKPALLKAPQQMLPQADLTGADWQPMEKNKLEDLIRQATLLALGITHENLIRVTALDYPWAQLNELILREPGITKDSLHRYFFASKERIPKDLIRQPSFRVVKEARENFIRQVNLDYLRLLLRATVAREHGISFVRIAKDLIRQAPQLTLPQADLEDLIRQAALDYQRAQLKTLWFPELVIVARELGISEERIKTCFFAFDPRAAIIDLILEALCIAEMKILRNHVNVREASQSPNKIGPPSQNVIDQEEDDTSEKAACTKTEGGNASKKIWPPSQNAINEDGKSENAAKANSEYTWANGGTEAANTTMTQATMTPPSTTTTNTSTTTRVALIALCGVGALSLSITRFWRRHSGTRALGGGIPSTVHLQSGVALTAPMLIYARNSGISARSPSVGRPAPSPMIRREGTPPSISSCPSSSLPSLPSEFKTRAITA